MNNLGVCDEYDYFDQEHEIEHEDDREEDVYKMNWNRGSSRGGIHSKNNTNNTNINIIDSKDVKKKNIKKSKIQDFSFFVNEIYRNCIKQGISPIVVPYWIKDLMDIFNNSDSRNHSAAVLNSNYILEYNNKENENFCNFDCIQDINISTLNDSALDQQQQPNSITIIISNKFLLSPKYLILLLKAKKITLN